MRIETEKRAQSTETPTPDQRMLLALRKARARLEAVERSQVDPIAIIGMACRFPGGADNPEAYWELLENGVDAIKEVPPERWSLDAFYDPTPESPGKMYSRFGGFLRDIDQFDPQFFGISPREARSLDPQQRLLLEVAWEALERAGQVREQLRRSATGVFIGIMNNDYARLILQNGDFTNIDVYFNTGNALSAAAGRLAYFLGLQGPCMSLDTACSSSLVAVHEACQSLRNDECSMALAGGVNLILSPEGTIGSCRAQMLAKDGRCKTFDASADGYVRSEGCGIVILKRLSRALADGDPVLALIRGAAINQDGLSNGLAAPSGNAQQALIRKALANARVKASEVGYVEMHGTGTALGDPIEVEALGAAMGEAHSSRSPLLIGSVKTNLGHLESAAGIAGLMKVVLALQHQKIPRHLHFQTPNPHIPWVQLPVKVTAESSGWPTNTTRRIAGVSSFGFTGTNAHVLLEAAPPVERASNCMERPVHLLTLSAKTDTALLRLAGRYARYLSDHPEVSLADFCFSANTGRSRFACRLGSVARDAGQLERQLSGFARGEQSSGTVSGKAPKREAPKIVFLFSGQGAQYTGMGRELYQTQPLFRQELDRCDEILRPYLEDSLLTVLYPNNAHTSRPSGSRAFRPDADTTAATTLDQTLYTQTALFAIGHALCRLWKSWGVVPDVVLGHSLGEYIAACAAGVFSLEDGLKMIVERGRLISAVSEEGEMVTVFADEERVLNAIEPYAKDVSIAAVNGPEIIVISGRRPAVRAVVDVLAKERARTIRLNISHGFHSPLTEGVMEDFRRIASEVIYHAPEIDLISNVTGQFAADEITTPDYWCRHLRETVRFAASMETLHGSGYPVFVEIGPEPTLLGIDQCLPEKTTWPKYKEVRRLPSLSPGQSDWQQLLQSLGELFVAGLAVDWRAFDKDYQRRCMPLPTYPFERQRYWCVIPRGGDGAAEAASTQGASFAGCLFKGDTAALARNLQASQQFSEDEAALLPRVLDALTAEQQRQTNAAALRQHLYRLEWQLRPDLVQPSKAKGEDRIPGGCWVVFADRQGLGRALSERLEAGGDICVCIYEDDAFKTKAPDIYGLDPADAQGYERLLQILLTDDAPPLKGLVHLWSLDLPSGYANSAEMPGSAHMLGCDSVLHLLRQLPQYRTMEHPPRLWLVTRGAMSAGDQQSPPNLFQAPLWGLGKVIAAEHPNFWGGMVDLSPEDWEDDISALATELLHGDEEDQLVLRNGRRFGLRLVPSQFPDIREVTLRPEAAYMITGGLGALGLHVAQWMVRRGVRHLALVGRSAPSHSAQEIVEHLEQAGAIVQVIRADVSRKEDVVRAIGNIQECGAPLRGIVHAAGVPGDQNTDVTQVDFDMFAAVLRPKVHGTWVLHHLTQNLPLDFLITFSSLAPVWGSKGQAAYAAANHFLDQFGQYRRDLGLPGLTINWGPWAGGGMASSEAQAWLTRNGVELLSPEPALELLGDLLGAEAAQIIVTQMNWDVFKSLYTARRARPLLEHIVTAPSEVTAPASPIQTQILKELAQTAAGERRERLMAYVRVQVAGVLGFGADQRPGVRQGFFEMGMDSLMAVKLKKNIEAGLGASLPMTVVFDFPSIEQLVDFLAAEVMGWNGDGVPNVKTGEDRLAISQTAEEIQVKSQEMYLSKEKQHASVTEKLTQLESLLRVN